jgi:hypothetical protein
MSGALIGEMKKLSGKGRGEGEGAPGEHQMPPEYIQAPSLLQIFDKRNSKRTKYAT